MYIKSQKKLNTMDKDMKFMLEGIGHRALEEDKDVTKHKRKSLRKSVTEPQQESMKPTKFKECAHQEL
jgi:hypothetical protein